MKTSVLGLGNMGKQLASRLIDGGHEVTVWNRSPGKADDLVAAGAQEAADPAQAADGADAVLVVLADDAALEAVLLPGGTPLAGQAAVVSCTTASVDLIGRLTDAYGERFVAAPILGAPQAVADGKAVYVLGGDPEVLDRLEPVWSALTETTMRTGAEPRSAAVVKLVSNSLMLSGLAVLGEAVATAQAAGLPAELVQQLFGSSAMVPAGFGNRLDDVLTGDHSDGWFAMPLGRKDLGLFATLAEEVGADVPLARLAGERYQQGVDAGLTDADVAAIVEVARRADG